MAGRMVPLLDMRRFNKLLAGASWMAEYGNPDVPEEWAYIRKWSPYQNIKKAKPKVKIEPLEQLLVQQQVGQLAEFVREAMKGCKSGN